MFTVEEISLEKEASETTINLESRRQCEDIMDRIYHENPSYWPYGLSVKGHDGGVYMIREASSKEPIGFTGWQERKEGGKKVGYYSIGILPEYRRNGYAKAAVKAVIQEKSARVDIVRAMVASHNTPSLRMADGLGVEVVKDASEKKAFLGHPVTKAVGSGLATGGILDALAYGKESGNIKDYLTDNWSISRGLNLGLNTALGSLIPSVATGKYPGLKPVPYALSIPAKDLILTATGEIPSVRKSMEEMAKGEGGLTTRDKMVGGGLLGAGLLGGGVLGWKLLNAVKKQQELKEREAGGRIRVTLPTKDPNDRETTVDMPLDDITLSRTQLGKLQRDTRRRVRGETKERTRKRKPKPKAELDALKAATVKKANTGYIKNLLEAIHA